MKTMQSINPATGQVFASYPVFTAEEVEQHLATALVSFNEYRLTSVEDRARWLGEAARILEAEKSELGRTMTLEMGKPLRAAIQEAEKCAGACRFYAQNAAALLADEEVLMPDSRAFITCQPLGPVLAVMPWNFPFWQVFRFAAPALMAGNVGLLKHASNVPGCALAIEDVFRRAGFPHGVFQTLLIGSEETGAVIDDRRVAAVTLTGSVAAGSNVAERAGKRIKKTVLELGGSDPFIVMPSADIERAAATAVQARTINNGQSCIAAKRFIIEARIADDFQELFVEKMRQLRVGDPLLDETDVGPLATADVLDSLAQQVEETVKMGARLLLGGTRVPGPGLFYEPTVLAEIPPGSPAHEDELFGPVASLFRAEGIEEAIRIANDTPFGLGACLWSNDPGEQALFVGDVQAGLVFINGMVASDPRLPFGGVKLSGYGRELGKYGIREFVNVKTVVRRESAPGASRTE